MLESNLSYLHRLKGDTVELIIIVLSLLFFCVLILGILNRSRDSFFIKYYGLENHKHKYLIQNIINYLFCFTILIITCFLYFYHMSEIFVVLIPIIVKGATVALKKVIQ